MILIEQHPEFSFRILGYTKRVNGFNYFEKIRIGTPIYELFDGRIFICQRKPNDPYLYPVTYRRASIGDL